MRVLAALCLMSCAAEVSDPPKLPDPKLPDPYVAPTATVHATTFPTLADPPTTMTLSASGGTLLRPDGTALDFRGAISCCMGAYGWPLFDEAWVDLVGAHRVNFLHARLGPFLTGVDGESDWAPVGGGYVETSGKADLDRFNETFFTRVRALISYARARGLYVEVDLADGWSIKHCGDLPGYSAWRPDGNVQGENVCATAGRMAPQPRHVAWLKKVIAETGGFDNVVYQDGNELSLVPGYDETWTRGLRDLLRAEEAAHGFKRHLFGTQADTAAAMALADYVERHGDNAAAPADCAGKPCLVNEYNPRPPLTPAQLTAQFCAARSAGTYYWYWRHGQTEAQLLATLTSMARPCPGE